MLVEEGVGGKMQDLTPSLAWVLISRISAKLACIANAAVRSGPVETPGALRGQLTVGRGALVNAL